MCLSHVPNWGGTWPESQECALTGNRTGDFSVHRPAFNPLSHTSQGSFAVSYSKNYLIFHFSVMTLINGWSPRWNTHVHTRETHVTARRGLKCYLWRAFRVYPCMCKIQAWYVLIQNLSWTISSSNYESKSYISCIIVHELYI